ncbi:hypothetical protein ACG83_11675 [Frankia sp. R43]|uniref:hypothetical protein n=1 Tax=Frankia sp. R43 TaxID=269536 RepID=UPI0006CA1E8B|nr:hypothetical protein [Frankia sp. R43]KPM55888.1 hypothetical protein ACG83_11675 [Frankia sp. R43]
MVLTVERRSLTVVRRAAALPVGMAVLLGLIVCLYGSTVTSVRPRGLPVLVAGPAQSTQAFMDEVEHMSPGAMRVTVVADADAADRALRDRKAYAAFVFTADGLSLRLASAASPAVAEALVRGMAMTFPDLRIPVVDVVPNAAADHQGGGVSAGYLPLVLIAAAVGVLLARSGRSRQQRLVGLSCFVAAGGVAGTLALSGGLDVLPDNFLRSVVVLAVITAAVTAPVMGLGAVAAVRGLVAAVALTVVGVALSGASSAPEMLPTPWGGFGQLLPPGAGVTLARSTLYFDGAGGGRAAAVLTIWAVAGIALMLVGRERAGAGRARGPEAPLPGEPAPAEVGTTPVTGQIVRPREGGLEISHGVSPREEGFRA